MHEEEKIFAGKLFNNQCAELRAIKRKSHAANQRYNRLDETDPERDEIIRSMLGRVGETFHLVGPIHFNYGTHTFIGENFFANFKFTVMDDARVFIGDNVCIGRTRWRSATPPPSPRARMARNCGSSMIWDRRTIPQASPGLTLSRMASTTL